MIYPTKEEIIEAIKTTDINPYISTVKMWKIMFYNKKWSKMDKRTKHYALMTLAINLLEINNITDVKVKVNKLYCYNTITKEIFIANPPSIISTLHEVGHVLFGIKEIDACRFSIALFQETFPTEFKKLKWEGHMLIKK